jgi:hypothetical protein
MISSLETLEFDIRSAVTSPLLDNSTWEIKAERFVQGALAKYGLIDAEFKVPASWLESNYQQGESLLTALGFDVAGVPDDSLEYAVLETLYDELKLGVTWLKLFLRAKPTFSENTSIPVKKLSADYLPRTFIVEDACLSNAGIVWLTKHFYW